MNTYFLPGTEAYCVVC